MQFRAEQYYRVSQERIAQASSLYRDGGAYSLSMYCSGLAVESLLRAFRWRADAAFDGRHDLSELLKASGMLRVAEDFARGRGESAEVSDRTGLALREAMNEVITLWHNDLRYASEAGTKAYLRTIGRVHGVSGDPLKKAALDLVKAAQTVLNTGVALWNSRTK